MFFYLSISFGYLYFKVDAYDQSHSPVSNIPFEYDRGDIDWFLLFPVGIDWNNQWHRWQGNNYYLTGIPGRDYLNLSTSYDTLRIRVPTDSEPYYSNDSLTRSQLYRNCY